MRGPVNTSQDSPNRKSQILKREKKGNAMLEKKRGGGEKQVKKENRLPAVTLTILLKNEENPRTEENPSSYIGLEKAKKMTNGGTSDGRGHYGPGCFCELNVKKGKLTRRSQSRGHRPKSRAASWEPLGSHHAKSARTTKGGKNILKGSHNRSQDLSRRSPMYYHKSKKMVHQRSTRTSVKVQRGGPFWRLLAKKKNNIRKKEAFHVQAG